MNKLSLTVRTKFDAAHRLTEHDGKCKNLHGHTYHLEVAVCREDGNLADPTTDMVVDFSDLKKIVNEVVIDKYDHAYISAENDFKKRNGNDDKVAEFVTSQGLKVVNILVPWNVSRTTAEMMVLDISKRLFSVLLEKGLRLERLRLWETENCSVELTL